MSDTGSDQPDPDRPGWSEPAPGQPPEPWAAPPAGQPQYGQPQYGQPQYGAVGAPPPNHLVWAILSTLFCCLPLGIVSIVFAAQVNGKFAAGDVAGAQESSRKAKTFAIWSAAVGLVVAVIYIGLAVVIATGNN